MKKYIIGAVRFVAHNKVLFQLIQFLGLCVLSVGSYSLLGYIAHREDYYRWDSDVGMALNTSILFVITGIVILLIMVYVRKLEERIDGLENFAR